MRSTACLRTASSGRPPKIFMRTSAAPIQQDFSGLWIPLVTSLKGGELDLDGLTRLVSRLNRDGISDYVVCGSTGEAAALSEREQLLVLDTVLNACEGLPVVMGLSGYNLIDTKAWVSTLCSKPIQGLLVPAPHYIRPSQDGIIEWFTVLAETSVVPIIVYNIPYRAGTTMTLETLQALAALPCITAVKDCGGDLTKTLAFISDQKLQVFDGDDLQMFVTCAQGGSGVIAASSHTRTAEFAQLLKLLRDGALLEAQPCGTHSSQRSRKASRRLTQRVSRPYWPSRTKSTWKRVLRCSPHRNFSCAASN